MRNMTALAIQPTIYTDNHHIEVIYGNIIVFSMYLFLGRRTVFYGW